MRWLLPLFAAVLILLPPAHAFAGGKRVAVTVMPFVALDDKGEEEWLGKALSDMVARKLAENDGFDVLERDKLQSFLKEMELQQSGFTDEKMLQRLGSLAKVDSVLYGNYAEDGGAVTLNLLEMDVATQKILHRAEASGKAGSLPEAAGDLVVAYLTARGETPDAAQLENIRFRATDSQPAVKHFYEGLTLYDAGRYEDAYGRFLQAANQDGKYHEARLWAGRMLEYTGQTEQAVMAYRKLYDDAPLAVEGRDALLFAGRLLENPDPGRASGYYRTLADLAPKIPESLEAAWRLAAVLQKQGKYADAYRALQEIQTFREEADKLMFRLKEREVHREREDFLGMLRALVRLVKAHGSDADANDEEQMAGLADLTMRQSRFYDWDGALALYRGTVLQMVSLFRKALKEDPALKPPRGTFAVDPAHPVITEARYGETKSLFFKDTSHVPGWSENFYAAVIPDGYVATGVKLRMSGRLPNPTSTTDFTFRVFGFPLVRNYYNQWLGVIYGQTPQLTTLQKEIPFHGRDRDILVFQLIENRSEIRDWQVEFILRKGEAQAVPAAGARLKLGEDPAAGVAAPQYIEQYGTKKRLAVAASGYVVAAKGSLASGDTDLWGGTRGDGLKKLLVNSQSNDFAPQLVQGEDGRLRLFWISDRRGLGWELWTSVLDREWSQPSRIALETGTTQPVGRGSGELLEFAAVQDHLGRFLAAVCLREGGIAVFSSTEGEKWERTAGFAGDRLFNPVFHEDKTSTYWLGAIDGGAMFQLHKSFDLKKWETKKYALGSYSRHWSDGGNGNYGSVAQVAGYPMYMGAAKEGGMTLLFSDTLTGLQYASFRPDTEEPSPDLVRGVTLEPYAAAQKGDAWTIASWEGDEILLQDYKHFAFPTNGNNAASDPLYHETEFDRDGNRWDRRIARTRYVKPDVTAVGASSDGRAWWGIETGVMALKGSDFFVSDVSMGFFHHQVTDIVPCGDKTYFASRSLDAPAIGVISSGWLTNKTERLEYPELKTGISAIACGAEGRIILGTRGGDVALAEAAKIVLQHHVGDARITAVAQDGDRVLAGTASGGLYQIRGPHLTPLDFRKDGAEAVTGISTNGDAAWVSTAGGGLFRRANNAWQRYTPENSPLPYASAGKIKAQGGGVWIMPDYYTQARGIAYFDGASAALYSPPSHNIYDMIDFDLAPDGSVWIGSESTGIYRFEREK